MARGFSADIKHLTELIKGAIQHEGFSLIDIFSPCVTFNHDNDFAFFKSRVKKLEDVKDDAVFEDATRLLFEQAMLIEGVELKAPAEFNKRLNRALERAL